LKVRDLLRLGGDDVPVGTLKSILKAAGLEKKK
jgi:predicted RNA binding protein YcfA (HicA-like mRNA interferase family)